MNLEDTIDDRPDLLADLNLQKEKIRAVIETSARAGVALVLNARTDVFLASIGAAETRLARTSSASMHIETPGRNACSLPE